MSSSENRMVIIIVLCCCLEINALKRWASDIRRQGSKENAYLSAEKIVAVTVGGLAFALAIIVGVLCCWMAYQKQKKIIKSHQEEALRKKTKMAKYERT
ncbi:Uncharacterised protein g9414 [Pycnogonum litorale]